MPDNWAVVDEEKIRHALEPGQRFALIDADRLVGEIAAGRDDRETESLSSAGGAGECKEASLPGRDCRAQLQGNSRPRTVLPSTEKDDGRFGRTQQSGFKFRDRAIGACSFNGGVHQCKRLFLPVFSETQCFHGFGIACVGQQLKASKSFYRDNFSLSNRFGRLYQGVISAGNGSA